jgi:hypothetical protein
MCNSPIRVHNNLQTVGIGYSSNNWAASYNTAGMAVLQLGGTMNATGTVALDINGVVRGIGYIATSDARFKTNVRSITNASETIKRLRGVSYGWVNNEETKRLDNAAQLGFIAQEVEPIVPPAVYKDEKGVYGLNYNTFIPLLVEAFKELDAKVTALQTENQELKAEVNRLCAEGCGAFNGATSIQNGMGSYLFQNEPNPTSDNTVIRYYVHNFTVKASIVVATLDGKPVMDIPVTKGQGNISVNTKNLGQGTYLYTLMIDGRIVDSKAMVIAK